MKKNNIFWVGFSDLMTSLFFVMLVLFVLAVGYLKISQRGLIKEVERVNKLLNMEKQFEPLKEDGDFYYLEECKKFIAKDLMGVEIFEPNKTNILPQYKNKTINLGNKLKTFLIELQNKNPEFSYLLVIEGNMANDWKQSINKDNNWGYEKSFQRALAVYNLWLSEGINFRDYNVEVMLCGSGFNGLCRDSIEENNKRFSIQIIPKVEN